ncbi:MAG: hypothetical protein H6835_14050 [Planctomycetes bacterium]|nr:hypothetical protein [Planctomycetota bacterium]
MPPSNTRQSLGNLFALLEQAKARQQKTKIGGVLHELAGQVRQRGMVMIFSDLFDEPEAVLKGRARSPAAATTSSSSTCSTATRCSSRSSA